MKRRQPRVTWLLPVRNGKEFLEETLSSIEGQSYGNWEVLIWDNSSTDGTQELLEKWVPSRLPGRLVLDKPMNLGECRGEMVSMSNTEYCALLDADDVAHPNRLEMQVNYMEAHPDCGVVGTQYSVIDENSTPKGQICWLPPEHEDIVNELFLRNAIAQPAVLLRREAVIQSGNYRNVGEVNIEDYDLWLRMCRKWKLANLPEVLLSYRIHSGSTTQWALRTEKLHKAMHRVLEEHSQETYGVSASDTRQLTARSHPSPAEPLKSLARRFSGGSSISRKVVDRQSFQDIISATTPEGDRSTRVKLALAAGDYGILGRIAKKRFKGLAKKVLKALGFGRLARAVRNYVLAGVPQPQTHYHQVGGEQIPEEQQVWACGLRTRKKVHVGLPIEVLGPPGSLASVEVGEKCYIERDLTLWLPAESAVMPKLVLRDGAYIGRNTYLGAYERITIGRNVQIGAYSYIISANHRFERRDIPIKDQGFAGAPVLIEDDAWLGTHVVVLPGVTIGQGAIIGAGSLVSKDVPPYEIWGGVPAKFIKVRPG